MDDARHGCAELSNALLGDLTKALWDLEDCFGKRCKKPKSCKADPGLIDLP